MMKTPMKRTCVSAPILLLTAMVSLIFYALLADAARSPVQETTTRTIKHTVLSSLTDSEKNWLEENHTVRVRVADTPPYQSRLPEASGIAVDYIERTARDLGFGLAFVTDDIQFQTALDDITGNHEIYDLLLTIKRTPARAKHLSFTDDYIFIPLVIVSRKNDQIFSAGDLENKTLAFVKGYAVNNIVQSQYAHINILEKTNPSDALYTVATSGADAYIGDLSIVNYLIKQQGLHNLKITAGTPFGIHNQAMGVRKDWPELASILSKYFRAMTPQDHLAIFDRWVNISDIPMNLPYKHVPMTSEERRWVEAHPEVTFGGGPFPPFDYTDQNGRITGISPEYITLLGHMLGIHFSFVTGEWPQIQHQAREHKIDGLRTIIPGKDNGGGLAYTHPYAVAQHCILMHTSAKPASTLKELSHTIVGTVEGTVAQTIIQEKYPDIILSTFRDFDQALDALVSGKLDALIGPLPVLTWLMDPMYLSDFVVTGLPPDMKKTAHIAVRDDWPELVTLLNKAMLEVSPEQFRAISQKWISTDLAPPKKPIVLTMEEKKWLKSHPVIRVGAHANRDPLEFIDHNGDFQGISVDYLKKIETILGIRFDIVKIRKHHTMMNAAGHRPVDMLSVAEKNPENTALFTFSRPYITSPLVIFSRPDMPFVGNLEGLKGRKVAVLQGDAILGILAREYPDIIPVPVPDIKAAMDLLGPDADAVIGCPFMVSHLIMMQGKSLVKVVGETPYTYQPAMASRSDWPVFVRILQKALDGISEAERNAIYSKWVSIRKEQVFDYSLIWKVAGSAILAIGLILLWNRRLKIEVRKQTATIKESEELLQVIFDSTPQIMVLVSENLDILKINQSGIRESGSTEDLPRGFRLGNIINCSTAASSGCGKGKKCDDCDLCKTVKKTFKDNDNACNVEARIKPDDNLKRSEKIFLISTAVVQPESPRSILVILDDITEFRTMEEHLRQSQKMEAIGTLAGGIAHDFNNILSIILGYTEMSLEDIEPSSDIHANLKEVLASSQRAKELVTQILTFSRLSKKELSPIHIQEILKEALILLHASIPSTIEIKEEIDPSCQTVLADATQIHQIIMNLCTNAYHAMHASGGVLGISMSQVYLTKDILHLGLNLSPGLYIDLKISDTGCGISQDQLKKIFEPYYTTKPKEQGTGLGLAIVHGIVRNYSGDIYVYSEPGIGTTFHVYLPITEQDDATLAPGTEAKTLPTGMEHILLVDDDEKIVAMQKKMLEDLGYRITTATQSVTALAKFQKHPEDFDIVITDMTMPGMTGDQLAQKILSVKPDVPVVLCTGYSDLITEKKAKDIGIRQFLMKPVNRQQLAGKVRALLDSK